MRNFVDDLLTDFAGCLGNGMKDNGTFRSLNM